MLTFDSAEDGERNLRVSGGMDISSKKTGFPRLSTPTWFCFIEKAWCSAARFRMRVSRVGPSEKRSLSSAET